MFLFLFISMSFSTEFNEKIAKKLDYLVDKYEAYANKVVIRGSIKSKDYGLKIVVNMMDRNPVPIDIVNLTVRLMFEAELPLLDKFIATVDFAVANILDLYDQSELPEVEILAIESDEALSKISACHVVSLRRFLYSHNNVCQ